MARNIKVIRLEMIDRTIIRLDNGQSYKSIVGLCLDRALRKLSHIMVHKIVDLYDRPLKMERPLDMMAALITVRLKSANCGPGTDGANVVDIFYRLVEDHACIDDLIHSQLIGPFIAAYTRRFIRWYGQSLQARGMALED